MSKNKETSQIIVGMTVYHFIKFKPSGGFLTMVNRQAKPMYICFSDKRCADRCITHFAKFKHEYGMWPSIDLSVSNEITVRTSDNETKYPLSHIYGQMAIDSIYEEEVLNLGVPLMYCHTFGVLPDGLSKMNVLFSGEEIEFEDEPDEFAKRLEDRISD